jgi:response regulator RpfG family c-di-GMP phosphodiesterase
MHNDEGGNPTPDQREESNLSREYPELAKKVLEYFSRNSQAMDSVDGIARFWLNEDPERVARCLTELSANGHLESRIIGGTTFFSVRGEGARSIPHKNEFSFPTDASKSELCGRILLVDDDAGVRNFLIDVLGATGHKVEAAESGEQAIEKLAATEFDLVITDLVMPGVSGLMVLEKSKQVQPGTPVIVVSAHATVDTAIQALRKGAYDFLTKPFEDLDLIYRTVERAREQTCLKEDNRLLLEKLQIRNLELKQTISRLAAINEISKTVTGVVDLQELYESVVQIVARHLQARRVSVLVSEPDSKVLNLVASMGISQQEVTRARTQLGKGIASRVAETESPLLVTDIEKSIFRQFRKGQGYTTSSFMVSPIRVSYQIRYQRKRIGVINVSDKISGDPFTDQDLEFLSTLASQVAVAIENASLVQEMEGGYLAAMVSLIQAAENSRPETRGHSMRVARLAESLARELNLDELRVKVLFRAAAIHEIGRITQGSPNPGSDARLAHILEDWTSSAAMATEQVLAPIGTLQEVRKIILHSVDRIDASNVSLTSGWSGISIESRILSACEDFVRLTPANGNNPERAREALEVLRGQAGKKHDPDVVTALCQVVEKEKNP